jgi:hypothetical protein
VSETPIWPDAGVMTIPTGRGDAAMIVASGTESAEWFHAPKSWDRATVDRVAAFLRGEHAAEVERLRAEAERVQAANAVLHERVRAWTVDVTASRQDIDSILARHLRETGVMP